jgi:hypothetical protein
MMVFNTKGKLSTEEKEDMQSRNDVGSEDFQN